MVGPGGVKVMTKQKPVIKARVAWANFHETGYYTAFEPIFDDESRAALSDCMAM
jgi:hypothetical protein